MLTPVTLQATKSPSYKYARPTGFNVLALVAGFELT